MTNTEAREIFNTAAASAKTTDQVAKIELAREFFTNPEFRKALEQHVWEINQKAGR